MIPNPYLGKFFAFEGPDGCGKSIQIQKTYNWLSSTFKAVVKTKEPNKNGEWGSRIYEELNKQSGLHISDSFGFQRWYACDSKINVRKEVIPRLRAGCTILSDRYRPSLCYGAKNKDDIRKLMIMNERIIGEDFIWPDAVLIFNVDTETCIERLRKKGRKLDEYEKLEILKRVRDNYLDFATMYRNCYVIDGMQSENQVFESVKSVLSKVMNTQMT